jgi:glutamate-1-semialdehyde 2,1-aminomutase
VSAKGRISSISTVGGRFAKPLVEIERQYRSANPKSHQHYARSSKAMPGGNTRTVLYYDPFPVTIVKGREATVWDLDGHAYTDFVNEYSAGLYGHSHPRIQSVVTRTLRSGISLGGPNSYETKLATLISQRFPACEQLRFCNSGTEANLMAISLARSITGKAAVMVFQGGYHGGVFDYAKAGSPINIPFPTVVGQYNAINQTVELIEKHARALAAVIVEPMMGAAGCIPAELQFLRALRSASASHGVLLIFDEVMTSRLAIGGMHGNLHIRPDLVTLGKYLGGGLTFGAFGGRKEYMARMDPRRADALTHSGTYNNNILAMAAGAAGLQHVYTPRAVATLNNRGDELRNQLNELGRRVQAPFQATGIGSILCMHFQRGPINRVADVRSSPLARKLLHLTLLCCGLYTARRGYVSLSLPLTKRHHQKFLSALEGFLIKHRKLLNEADEAGSDAVMPRD